MADAAPAPGITPEVFQRLVGMYGLQGALSLLSLFNPNASTASKAMAGGQVASTGAQAAGNLGGSPGLAGLGRNLGLGLGLAGLGYNAYNVATNPNLSAGRKGAEIGSGVGGLGASYLFGPWGAASGIATAAGGQLEKSGSPQWRGLGRGLSTAGRPIDYQDIKNPFTGGGLKRFGQTLALGGPAGLALSRAIGFNPFEPTPTKGTQFRSDLQQIFGKLGLPSFNRADPNVYTAGADPNAFYAKYDPTAVSNAQQLGQLLAQLSPIGKKNDAYSVQAQNILLSTLGNSITQKYPDLLKQLQGG